MYSFLFAVVLIQEVLLIVTPETVSLCSTEDNQVRH